MDSSGLGQLTFWNLAETGLLSPETLDSDIYHFWYMISRITMPKEL